MSFLGLIAKTLFRQRTRTALTTLGIAVGITTVVALGVITAGFKQTAGDLATGGGADFMVAQEGASDMSFSSVAEKDVAAVAKRPDVARVVPFALEILRVESNPFFLLFGIEPQAIPSQEVELVRGRWPVGRSSDQVALGADAAKRTGSEPGETIILDREEFEVVGVYRAGDKVREGGAFAPLRTVQRLANRTGAVTGAFVTVAPGENARAVADAIETDLPQLATVSDAEDYKDVDEGMKVMDSMNLAISLLAVGIGAIGVMNTMIMSVFERTREIGILRAVGWRGSRIMRMIASESLFLCLVASIFGIALGVLASRAVMLVPAISSYLDPIYEPAVFVRALAVGVLVAFAGAAYPAFRAVRLSPMEALRHE